MPSDSTRLLLLNYINNIPAILLFNFIIKSLYLSVKYCYFLAINILAILVFNKIL